MDQDVPGVVVCGDLSLLRCFIGQPFPTAVVSARHDDVTFYSRHCRERHVIRSPADRPDDAALDLLGIGARIAGRDGTRPVLIYGDDATLLMVSRHRDRLEAVYRFLMPPRELLQALVDKARFAALAARLGLPVPRTVSSTEVGSAEELLARLTLPCVLKPCVHIGWSTSAVVRKLGGKPRKVLRADTPLQLRRLWADMRHFPGGFLAQEYIPGADSLIYSFHAYLDQRGDPLAYFVGHKLRTYPKDAGVSTFLELADDPEVVWVGLSVLATLRVTGVVKIDMKRDPRTGAYYVLELNPRFNLWHQLGAACGVNLPLVAYADLTGRPHRPQRGGYRTDVRWLAFGDDLRAFLRDYAPDGDLSLWEWLRSFRGRKVYSLFSPSDPLPLLMNSVRYVRALSRRLAFGRAWP
jgi:predicted ATP-grasp superfamily ATP-dependent carboligase